MPSAGTDGKDRRPAESRRLCLKGMVAGAKMCDAHGELVRTHRTKSAAGPDVAETIVLRANFRHVEQREWWLWAAAFVITLLLTVGLASFLLPISSVNQDFNSLFVLPQAIRGLVALVFLFDLYTIYQHLLIYRIRRELVKREELFHLISENAADMIAVVDMEGKRLFNSLSYKKVLGYSPEELQVLLSVRADSSRRS